MRLVGVDLVEILARRVEWRIVVLIALGWLRPVIGVDVGGVGFEVTLDLTQRRPRLLLERGNSLNDLLALGLYRRDRLGVALTDSVVDGVKIDLRGGGGRLYPISKIGIDTPPGSKSEI